MTAIDSASSIKDLLQILADDHTKKAILPDDVKQAAIDLIKAKAFEELEYGQEIKAGKVRIVKRVTGAVGLYFS